MCTHKQVAKCIQSLKNKTQMPKRYFYTKQHKTRGGTIAGIFRCILKGSC
uniref:Uncharacterized protein n=1 Tax=Arundo donax TaxID=35708 RepID=A0A0A9C786_ARUDO